VSRPAPRLVIAAALDVFDQEPPPEDHPLFRLNNVILTPYGAGLSKEAAIRIAIFTARNALAGRLDPSMVVNHEVL
jgi:D-3-phosphoglycerate dehydrogenase / 2-oxoglutarate reductase